MSAPTEPFYVVGVATRTTNADESDPATARLPELWQRAYGDPYLIERRERDDTGLVAVLTDYASDANGAYTEVVGVRVDSAHELGELPEGLVAVAVPAEPRTHVAAHGDMPAALIAAWQGVWERTDAGELGRSYRTDYEVHSEIGADLYVSTRAD